MLAECIIHHLVLGYPRFAGERRRDDLHLEMIVAGKQPHGHLGIGNMRPHQRAQCFGIRFRHIIHAAHSSTREARTNTLKIMCSPAGGEWWAHQDSNLEPTGYEPVALTN